MLHSFRYLKKFLLGTSTIKAHKAWQRNWTHKPQTPKQHSYLVKWPSVEPRVPRHQASGCCYWSCAGACRIPAWSAQASFLSPPQAHARTNRGCGFSSRSLSLLPLQNITIKWWPGQPDGITHPAIRGRNFSTYITLKSSSPPSSPSHPKGSCFWKCQPQLGPLPMRNTRHGT